jgi:hypothetical protein
MGVSGTPVYAGYVLSPERSSKLVGQEKYRTYSDLLSNTAIVAAGVRYFLNIIAKPNWNANPVSDKAEARQYSEFVDEVLDALHTPWSRVVRRSGTYRFHGFNIQEWTAVKRDDGKIGFHDIESRPQWTIWRWEVDERGTVIGAWQRDPLTGRELGLPRGKIMYLVDDTLTDNPEGLGLFRHLVPRADRLTEYEYNEGIGFLRELRGIPIGRAPIDELQASVRDGRITQAQMDQAIQNLKTFVGLEKKDEKTSLVLNSAYYMSQTDTGNIVTAQPKWDMQLVSGDAPSLNEVGAAIVRLNQEMARILGCEHLLLGADAAGSYAMAKEKAQDLYLLANSVLRDLSYQAQHDLLLPLWSLNGFPEDMMPELVTEDVSPKDVQRISATLRDMATAGAVLAPDDPAINDVRDLLGIEQVDFNKLAAEQMPEEISTGSKKRDEAKDEYYEAKIDALRDDEEGVEKRMNGGNGHNPFLRKTWSDAAREASAAARQHTHTWQGKSARYSVDEARQRLDDLPKITGEDRWFNPSNTGSDFGPEVSVGDAGLQRTNNIFGMKDDSKSIDATLPLKSIHVYQPQVNVALTSRYIEDPPTDKINVAGVLKDGKLEFTATSGTHRMVAASMRGVDETDVRLQITEDGHLLSRKAAREALRDRLGKYIPGNGTVRARSQNERRVRDMNMVAEPPPHWGAGGKGGYEADEGYFDSRAEMSHSTGPTARYGLGNESGEEHEIEESQDAVRREARTQRNSGGGRPGKTRTRTTRRTGEMK